MTNTINPTKLTEKTIWAKLMPKAIFIYCLVRVLEQKQSDDFTARLLAVRHQWRYEVNRCGFMGVEND